jgi:hypothetical protein
MRICEHEHVLLLLLLLLLLQSSPSAGLASRLKFI